jgi:ribosome-interacting GTPase 1
VDQLVDVVQGNREYKPCLYLYNKIDTVTIEEIDQLARMPHSVVGSVAQHFNIGGPLDDDYLKQKLWEYLGLTRVYTKRKGNSCIDKSGRIVSFPVPAILVCSPFFIIMYFLCPIKLRTIFS